MNILLLGAFRLTETWPMALDATGAFVPPVTQTQLAAMITKYLPEHSVTVFDGYLRKMSVRQLKTLITDIDILGLTCATPYMALNIEMHIKLFKRMKPSLKIMLGGHHATFHYERWLKNGADFVIRHEGEETVVDLLSNLDHPEKVKGIAFLDESGKTIVTERRLFSKNLDDYPIPRFDLLDYSPYYLPFSGKGFSGSVEFSRGCSHTCEFCIVPEMWKCRQRTKSPDRIMKELETLYKLNVNKLWIVDDNFGDDIDAMKETFRRILASPMKFQFMSFLRVDTVLYNPEFIEMIAAAGLKFALVGYETLSQDILDKFQKTDTKPFGVSDYKKCYQILKKHGIQVLGFFIIGYYDQTSSNVGYDVFEVCDLPTINRYDPLLGTRAYQQGIDMDVGFKDMFYHFQNTTSFPGQVQFYLPSFFRNLRMFFSPYLISKMFRGSEVSRRTFRIFYQNFLLNMMNTDMEKIRDFATLKNVLLSHNERQKLMVHRHVCPENIDRIVKNDSRILGKGRYC